MKEPLISVGILSGQSKIAFTLLSTYKLKGKEFSPGDYEVVFINDRIVLNGEEYNELTFEADNLHSDAFEIKKVIIGVSFHWERQEDQKFLGGLQFIVENNALTAVNIVSLEDYLISVISSEMRATSSEHLLKAHAVISRSWLLAQIHKNNTLANKLEEYKSSVKTPTEIIRWYDREDHANFDVCADDHCQRYQGITKQSTDLVNEVIEATKGEVIEFKGILCDARFSKCCGGIMEQFENVWEPVPHPYLQGKADRQDQLSDIPDLGIDEEVDEWIRSSPEAFCNTQDLNILKQVLNDYDQETSDFYRWKVEYTQDELSDLIFERSGIDFGSIIDLEPLERGTSGRIIRIKIIGTEKVMIIGKELEIRRTLSHSHLYSSAFVVDTEDEDEDGVPGKFILTGAGWGHGVGLCQIGAAVMAAKEYHYKEILKHYFPNTEINKIY